MTARPSALAALFFCTLVTTFRTLFGKAGHGYNQKQ
jgi:hypothetical protein